MPTSPCHRSSSPMSWWRFYNVLVWVLVAASLLRHDVMAQSTPEGANGGGNNDSNNNNNIINCGTSPCKGGCFDSNANGECEAVPAGYYSPVGDDSMYPCAHGSYASDEGNRECAPCEPGTSTNQFASTTCAACRPGEYAPALGSTSCLKCKTKYYFGFGAYAIFYDGADWYCLPPDVGLQSQSVTPTVTASPTIMLVPTKAPTMTTAAPVVVPSNNDTVTSPSPSISLAPTITMQPTLNQTSDSQGSDDSEGESTHKSKVFWKYFFLWIVVFVIVVACIVCWYRRRRNSESSSPTAYPWYKKKPEQHHPSASSPKATNGAAGAGTGAAAPWSPTTTLGSVTLGGGPYYERGDSVTLGEDEEQDFGTITTNFAPNSNGMGSSSNNNTSKSNSNFVLNDLYSLDIPNPPPRKKFNFNMDDENSVVGSVSDLYLDDVSMVDSTADDYSLKF